MSGRRARLAGLVATTASALALGPAASTASGPIALGATAYDSTGYSLILSRAKVNPGDRTVQFVNKGEDAHNLNVKRVGGSRVFAAGEVASGGDPVSLDVHFRRRSTYVLYCSLPGHRAQGMVAHVKVRRGA